MSTAVFTHIPCEVTDYILDHVCAKDGGKDDFKSLSACALVSKYFNTLVCPRLFERIRINDEWGYGVATKPLKRLDALCALLETSPVLATFVRHFTIETHLVGYPDYHGHDWILRNEQIPVILPQLTNLRSFAFQNLTGTVVWKYLSSDMSKAIQDICLKPSVSRLQLSNFRGMPVGWISRCENLEVLNMKYLSEDDKFRAPDFYCSSDDEGSIPSAITSLDILNATSCMQSFTRYSSFSNLRQLRVALHQDGDIDITRRVLQDSCSTLEELEIGSIIRSWGPLAPTLELHTLTALTRIKICSVLYVIDSQSLPEAITTVLELPEPSTSVESIHLTFEWGGARRASDGPLPHYLRSGWSNLDGVIKDGYPNLKLLILEFEDDHWGMWGGEGVGEWDNDGDGDGQCEDEEENVKRHLRGVLPGVAESRTMALRLVVTPCMAVYEL